MSTTNALPQFEDCIDAYLTAYDRHGTDLFTADRIDVDVSEPERVLDLAVAYGLLAYDGTAYNVRCKPGASAEHWESVVGERVTRIRRQISDLDGPAELTHEGGTYASAFVADADDFEAVAATAARVPNVDRDGVVLRSSAEQANAVQRYADRLCDRSADVETPLSEPLSKEATDVVGSDKDDLEFRLFLSGR